MKRNLLTFTLVAVAGLLAPAMFVGCATSSNDANSHERTAGQYIDDKVLAHKVRGTLDDNAVYKFPDVKVNTYKGTVQLSGFVETQEQKRQAEQMVRSINGVNNVEDNIVLKGETERVRGTSDQNPANNRNDTYNNNNTSSGTSPTTTGGTSGTSGINNNNNNNNTTPTPQPAP